jgi:hypothetical protein
VTNPNEQKQPNVVWTTNPHAYPKEETAKVHAESKHEEAKEKRYVCSTEKPKVEREQSR